MIRAAMVTLSMLATPMCSVRPSEPATAADPWLLTVRAPACEATMQIGKGTDRVDATVVAAVARPWVQLVIEGSYNVGGTKGEAVLGSSAMVRVPYAKRDVAKGRQRIAIDISRSDLKSVGGAGDVTVAIDGDRASIVLPGMPGLLVALDRCVRETAVRYGLDSDAVDRVAVDPVFNHPERDVIVRSDYPAKLAAAGIWGDVVVVWTFGRDGRVHDCRAVESFGFAEADAVTCAALTARARFKPARDHMGNAVPSYGARRIVWR